MHNHHSDSLRPQDNFQWWHSPSITTVPKACTSAGIRDMQINCGMGLDSNPSPAQITRPYNNKPIKLSQHCATSLNPDILHYTHTHIKVLMLIGVFVFVFCHLPWPHTQSRKKLANPEHLWSVVCSLNILPYGFLPLQRKSDRAPWESQKGCSPAPNLRTANRWEL